MPNSHYKDGTKAPLKVAFMCLYITILINASQKGIHAFTEQLQVRTQILKGVRAGIEFTFYAALHPYR